MKFGVGLWNSGLWNGGDDDVVVIPDVSLGLLTITDRSRQRFAVVDHGGQLYTLSQHPRNRYDVEQP